MSEFTDFKPDANATSEGFLGDLGPPIRRYRYKGIGPLLGTLESEWRRQEEEDLDTIQRRWSSFDSSLNLLLARLPTSRPHEIALHEFDTCLLDSLKSMGLYESLRKFGSATVCADSGSSKQPDLQYLPKRLPPGRTKQWPTVVVEIAYLDATSKLLSDTRFWLHESGGGVQTVITITIGRSMPRIALESWELYDGRLKRQQVVSISKADNQHVYLKDQPPVISFEKLSCACQSIRGKRNGHPPGRGGFEEHCE